MKRLRIAKLHTFFLVVLLLTGLSCSACCEQVFEELVAVSRSIPKEMLLGKLERPVKLLNKSFRDLDGNEVSLRDSDGKVRVILLWAPWNLDSVTTLTTLDNVAKYFGDNDLSEKVELLPIATSNLDDTLKVREVWESYALKIPAYFDQDNQLYDYLAVESVPTTVIIDKDGLMLYRIKGYIRLNNKDIVEELLSIANQKVAGPTD